MTVGWREFVGFPDLALSGIKAKIDTGARTSTLHAFRTEVLERDGLEWVRFWVHPLRKHPEIVRICEAPIVDRRVVSDSGGHRQSRIIIETTLAISNQAWPIEVSLTDRDSMLFPVLIGRTAMEGRLVVDPAASYTLGRTAGRAFRQSLLQGPHP